MASTATQAEPRLIALALPGIPRSVPAARRRVRAALGLHGLAGYADDAEIITSELVTNAVRHARTGPLALALRLESAGAWLRIEVHDADPHEPRQRTPGGLDESGFGLLLIEALAGKWGVRQTAGGKAVWAELDARQAVNHP
jgi:anti-sigma regulatory factor (Ser/Thr protein kinase)